MDMTPEIVFGHLRYDPGFTWLTATLSRPISIEFRRLRHITNGFDPI